MIITKIAFAIYLISVFSIAGSWDQQDEQQRLEHQETHYSINK